MNIKIESTTDTSEQITAAIGGKKPEQVVEESAAEDESAESTEESETSEEEPSEQEEEETEEPVEEKPRKKNGFQKRVDKLNKRISEKEREAEYWKQEALKAKPQETKQEPQKPAAESEPQEEDFESHKDYVKALARWEYKQAKEEDEAESKKKSVLTEEQKIQSDYSEKVRAFKEENDDFDDVMEAADEAGIRIPFHLKSFLFKQDPSLAYELAKNHDELKRIAKLGYGEMVYELGKFEAGISKKALKESEPKTTKAPAPIKPVGTKGSASTKDIYSDDISQRDYERARRKSMSA